MPTNKVNYTAGVCLPAYGLSLRPNVLQSATRSD